MNFSDTVKWHIDLLSFILFRRPRIFFFRNFENERKAAAGENFSESREPSVVFFTIHRCASTFVASLLRNLSGSDERKHIDFAAYFAGTDEKKTVLLNDDKFLKATFSPRGYIYGPFRFFYPIPEMKQYRAVLHLRDPRDVLVSKYYSDAYSHPVINRKIPELRRKALRMNLDEYVLETASGLQNTYRFYCTRLLHQPNVLFLKYEDMVSGFEGWLKKFIIFTGLNPPEKKITQILKRADFRVLKENIYSHKRVVTPGDHKNKLQKKTILKLNEIFKEEMAMLEYGDGVQESNG